MSKYREALKSVMFWEKDHKEKLDVIKEAIHKAEKWDILNQSFRLANIDIDKGYAQGRLYDCEEIPSSFVADAFQMNYKAYEQADEYYKKRIEEIEKENKESAILFNKMKESMWKLKQENQILKDGVKTIERRIRILPREYREPIQEDIKAMLEIVEEY